MSSDLRRRLGTAWEAAWNRGDTDALDRLLAPGYTRHGRTEQTRDDLKAGIRACREGMPDLRTVIDDYVADGDRLAVRWHSSGTHTGFLLGTPATGRRLTVSGATFSRVEDGTIAEEWVTWDPRQMLHALGVIPLDSGFEHLRGKAVTA
ncbi:MULTISPECIES: ester cyclase [Streptomyces]|uniref:ester cyclase n=1 Tax=Streptomyces TaxID=1883 RepID=UPI0004BD9E60|nr:MULTISPECIES: ester cyclase [Streptomyces]QHF96554.1 ester cyclase [Streptomyces sp. NHF165]